MQMVPISVRVSFLHLRRAEGHEGSPVLGILSFLCGPNRTVTFPFEDEAGASREEVIQMSWGAERRRMPPKSTPFNWTKDTLHLDLLHLLETRLELIQINTSGLLTGAACISPCMILPIPTCKCRNTREPASKLVLWTLIDDKTVFPFFSYGDWNLGSHEVILYFFLSYLVCCISIFIRGF